MDRKKNPMSRFLYHQPIGVVATIKVIKTILFQEGYRATLQKIFKHLYYKIKGVDFDFQSLEDLTIKSENRLYGTLCGSSNESTVKHLLDTLVELDSTILNGTFVDVGSGKGKLIIYAKEYGFNTTIGIEFAKELYDITVKNINALNVKGVTVIHQDVVDYILLPNTRVIYFLNPFQAVVFEKLLPKFIQQMQSFNHPIYLVYRVPIYAEVFKKYKELKPIKTENFQEDISEIYLFRPTTKIF
jgi:predicted RNA methylase